MKNPLTSRIRRLALGLCLLGHAMATLAATYTVERQINLGGVASIAELDDLQNWRLQELFPTDAVIVGLRWDVQLTAAPESWLSDVKVLLTGADASPALVLQPGEGDNVGGAASYSSGGVLDLKALNLSFAVAANGSITLQFYEVADEVAGADALFGAGSRLTLRYETATAPVPELPASALLLIGLGGLATLRRARPSRSPG